MARILTLTFEATDVEIEGLITKIGDRGDVQLATPPSTQAEAPAPQTANTELDEDGVPWHKDYHSGTKSKKNDGTWKMRSGCDKDAYKAYTENYTNAPPAPAPAPQVEAPAPAPAPQVEAPAPEMPDIPEHMRRAPAPATPPAPAIAPQAEAPQVPTPPPVPATAPAPAPVTYEQISEAFTSVIQNLGMDVLNANLARMYDVAGIPHDGLELQTNETARATMLAELNALLGGGH